MTRKQMDTEEAAQKRAEDEATRLAKRERKNRMARERHLRATQLDRLKAAIGYKANIDELLTEEAMQIVTKLANKENVANSVIDELVEKYNNLLIVEAATEPEPEEEETSFFSDEGREKQIRTRATELGLVPPPSKTEEKEEQKMDNETAATEVTEEKEKELDWTPIKDAIAKGYRERTLKELFSLLRRGDKKDILSDKLREEILGAMSRLSKGDNCEELDLVDLVIRAKEGDQNNEPTECPISSSMWKKIGIGCGIAACGTAVGAWLTSR